MKSKRNLIQLCLLGAVLLQTLTCEAQQVTKIACGAGHILFVKKDGSLWVMGYNWAGELGDGTYTSQSQPEQIVASGVTAVAAGYYHSLFLKNDGSLWCMGYNASGQLGDGTYNNTNRPEWVFALNVASMAGSFDNSFFVESDGSLWAMGDNSQGQFGNGTQTSRVWPTEVLFSNVVAVAAPEQQFRSLFLKNDGSLWGMGDNSYGEFGDGAYVDYVTLPEQLMASNVLAVAAGWYHTLVVKKDGSLWASGYNQNGQLGNGTYQITNRFQLIVASNVTAVAAGNAFSAFLKQDGSLWAMGGIGSGGNVPKQILPSSVTAITAGVSDILFIENDGSLWGMGADYGGNFPMRIVPAAPPVIQTQPANRIAPAGKTANFSISASSMLTMSYQWQKNGTNLIDGGNVSGAATSSLTLTNLSVSDQANYSAIVSNSLGAVTSSNATLTLAYAPGITAQPTNQLVLSGSNTFFGLSVTGSPPIYFQWRHSTTNLPNATNAIYIASSVSTNMAGNYSVVATNMGGTMTSSNAVLSVVLSPKNQTNLVGTTATFTNNIFGAQTMSFQWQKNGTNLVNGGNISGVVTNKLSIASVVTNDAANYWSIVSNGYGTVTSAPVSLTVILPPQNFTAHNLGTGLQLQLAGTPNYPYILQSATNLRPPISWKSLRTNSADAAGDWQFTDTNLNGAQKFYRALGQ